MLIELSISKSTPALHRYYLSESSNQAIKQSSNQAIRQRNAVITHIEQ